MGQRSYIKIYFLLPSTKRAFIFTRSCKWEMTILLNKLSKFIESLFETYQKQPLHTQRLFRR